VTLKCGLKVIQDHSKWYHGSIVTMALSFISSEKLVENRDFFNTPLHLTPPLAWSTSEYCHPVWYGKTKKVGLPDGEKTLRVYIYIFV